MTARRDLIPVAVTLVAAMGFVFIVARASRAPRRAETPPDTSTTLLRPHEASVPQSDVTTLGDTTSPTPGASSPSAPSLAPPPAPRGDTVAPAMPGDAGAPTPVRLDATRAELNALRAHIAAIDVDAGGASAALARRMLASAAAPQIVEILGEGTEGFEGRYEAYRASVLDGGAATRAQAQHLRPEDLARAALLDELFSLTRPGS